ncbi:cilium assembly protein DZIP1L isoform X2 [Ambystoma mexicanum]|uniref:cilium assembly protein DZIP1L isoform X2 n=1 Tax=Ambystoma mexicanum TaxID=8296 RepID=UPI0037E783A3
MWEPKQRRRLKGGNVSERRQERQAAPFVHNTYYPPQSSSLGPHSPKFSGKVLSMPYQQSPRMGFPTGNMQSNVGGIPAFKFQPRRDSIDWRRFSAIDVDRVAHELDVATLQENIGSITFCSLEGERCPYCQQPVDPVLLKVLKMAQLTIEYLLHSQEYLSSNMVMTEEQLQATLEEHENTKSEMGKMAEELKAVKEESKRRKKMLATQQLLFQAEANNYHKCQLCEKSFMNYSFLENHIERRHSEISKADKNKKKQIMQIEDDIEGLKAKLQKTEAENHHTIQELEDARHREVDLKREFERWKEEERTRFQQEMEQQRQLSLTQFADLANKNAALEEKLTELESRKVATTNLGLLIDDDDDDDDVDRRRVRHQAKHQQEIQRLRELMESQRLKWKQERKDLRSLQQQEKEELMGENEKLKAMLSKDQKEASKNLHQQISSLSSKIKDQEEVIRRQEAEIKELRAKRVEDNRSPQPVKEKPKPKEKANRKEEDEEDSTEGEIHDPLERKQKHLEVFPKDPNFLKHFRLVLEDQLLEKMEKMGVKKAARGISASTFRNIRGILQTQQEQRVVKYPDITSLKKKLTKEVTQKLKQMQSGSTLPAQPSIDSPRSTKTLIQPRPVSPKQKKVKVIESKPHPTQPPKPIPRSKIPSPATMPRSFAPAVSRPMRFSTPPFTSEEESVSDKAFIRSPRLKQPETSKQMQVVPKKQVDDIQYEDWSDTDFSDENASPMSTGVSAGRTDEGTLVHSMARSIEKQFSGQRGKPFGGVSLIPGPSAASTPSRNVPKKASDEDSDLEISSFDEITEHLDIKEKSRPIQARPSAVRLSADSTGSQGTSIWSSNSIRAGGW